MNELICYQEVSVSRELCLFVQVADSGEIGRGVLRRLLRGAVKLFPGFTVHRLMSDACSKGLEQLIRGRGREVRLLSSSSVDHGLSMSASPDEDMVDLNCIAACCQWAVDDAGHLSLP